MHARSLSIVLLAMLVLLVAALPVCAQYKAMSWEFDESKVTGYPIGEQRNDIVPGELRIDPPTLENLGFRWFIQGDSNTNATVEVAYRVKGENDWREAQPLLRVHHEIVKRFSYRDVYNHFRTGNLFAGSVLFLQPGTTYEVRFTMSDPDGGAPDSPRVVEVTTRSEPATHEARRTLHVYPPDFQGNKSAATDDTFADIPAAYAAAQPGDVIMLHEGTHLAANTPWLLEKSGEQGKPIVFRGEGATKTILQGSDLKTELFHLLADHITFEDLRIHNAYVFIQTSKRASTDGSTRGASWLTVRRCHVTDVIRGIWTYSSKSTNWYIADNVFTGLEHNEKWYPRTRDYMGGSHTAINVYGQGHVVCHNRITRYGDALAIANVTANTDDTTHAVNIDFYNNDLSKAMDDTIEADYGCNNIRVYQNLLYNTHTALSLQPSFGGPVYFIRNEAYGITGLNFKWNNQPTGILAFHNTLVSAGNAFNTPVWSNAQVHNNLLLGNGGLINAGTFTPARTRIDYNGYAGTDEARPNLIRWYHGTSERLQFPSLEAFTKATGYDAHSFIVKHDDIFTHGPAVVRGTTYAPADFDLTLKPGSKPVDAGLILPNINDHYAGQAPDLGASELGSQRPHYGPRE